MNRAQHRAAFVIQFQPGTDIEDGPIQGRVEHVASSRSDHFHSIEELLEFFSMMMKQDCFTD